MSSRVTPFRLALAAGLTFVAAPAWAAGQPATDADGRVFGDTINDPLPDWAPPTANVQPRLPAMPTGPGAVGEYSEPDRDGWEQARADWLSECRRRYGGKSSAAGGVVGGLVGGLAGSAIAGRGNRTIGAVVGGVAGAVTGAAIGSSADRRRSRDYCESYLDQHFANYGQNQGGYGYPQRQVAYGYAMQPMMVMVPVAMTTMAAPAAPRQNCTETEVIEEWVPVARPARRYIPRRMVRDKRVRIAPDKRVRTY